MEEEGSQVESADIRVDTFPTHTADSTVKNLKKTFTRKLSQEHFHKKTFTKKKLRKLSQEWTLLRHTADSTVGI